MSFLKIFTNEFAFVQIHDVLKCAQWWKIINSERLQCCYLSLGFSHHHLSLNSLPLISPSLLSPHHYFFTYYYYYYQYICFLVVGKKGFWLISLAYSHIWFSKAMRSEGFIFFECQLCFGCSWNWWFPLFCFCPWNLFEHPCA